MKVIRPRSIPRQCALSTFSDAVLLDTIARASALLSMLSSLWLRLLWLWLLLLLLL
jgi:hypothetical protein